MNSDFARQSLVGLRAVAVATVVLGVVYPAAVWGIGRLALDDQAQGQIVSVDGQDRGSKIIGQQFSMDDPQWFHGRPSVSEYDGLASAASNLGPSNPELLKQIEERRREVARTEGVAESRVPADAVTASASGLDPHISPAYAALQVDRVARARGLSAAAVRALVAEHTTGRQLGFLGEPTVNVLELNLALAGAH